MAGFHRKRTRSRRGQSRNAGPSRQAQAADSAADSAAETAAESPVPTPADVAAAQRDRAREAPAAATAPVADLDEESREPQSGEAERGLRGLVGSGSSQVTLAAAARARDAARPTDDDVARAERELTIVRRNWVPREPFRPGGKR